MCTESYNSRRSGAKPLLKWAGGKGQLLPSLRSLFPAELGKKIRRYAEPFIGGGAVLFDILNTYDLDEIYISDTNAALIHLYVTVRDNEEALTEELRKREKSYLSSDAEKRKMIYYATREQFNRHLKRGIEKTGVKGAADVVFLNKTGFNGLYRVNKAGIYNVPIGAYVKPCICDAENLRAVSQALQKVEIRCADYHAAEQFADENTFVYLDPPYRPLTDTAAFTSYTETVFDDNAQRELARFVRSLAERNVPFLLSNSDPKNVDENDTFFDDLYSAFTVRRIFASRMISSKATTRGKISELAVTNYE